MATRRGCLVSMALTAAVPGRQGRLDTVPLAASAIRISWSAPVRASIERQKQGEDEWLIVGHTTPERRSFDDGGLEAATAYRYRIGALVSQWTPTGRGKGAYRGALIAPADVGYRGFGTMCRPGGGRLLLIYVRSLTLEDAQVPGQALVKRESPDDGRTWTAETAVLCDAAWAYGKPSVARLTDGRLALAFVRFLPQDPARPTGPPGRAELMFSTASGGAWSRPVSILESAGEALGYVSARNDVLIAANAGRLLLPAMVQESGRFRTVIFGSDDNGVRWRRLGEIAYEGPGPGLWEASAAHLGGGRLLLAGRTGDGWYWGSTSLDNGATWTAARPLPLRGYSSPPIVAVDSGGRRLMIVYHPRYPVRDNGDRREVLAAQYSQDGGRTFEGYEEIEYFGTEYRSFQNHSLLLDRVRAFIFYSTSPDRDGWGDGRLVIHPLKRL